MRYIIIKTHSLDAKSCKFLAEIDNVKIKLLPKPNEGIRSYLKFVEVYPENFQERVPERLIHRDNKETNWIKIPPFFLSNKLAGELNCKKFVEKETIIKMKLNDEDIRSFEIGWINGEIFEFENKEDAILYAKLV